MDGLKPLRACLSCGSIRGLELTASTLHRLRDLDPRYRLHVFSTMAAARPEIVLIAALTEADRVIGKDNDLPWHIPEDLARFKRRTSGHVLLTGRRTFEAILHQFGGPLPDRRHLVLTRSADYEDRPRVMTVSSIPEAMDLLADEDLVYVGGGQTVYEQFLPAADRLELTLIETPYEGDTYFPAFEHLVEWAFEPVEIDRRDGFRFATYRRVPPSTEYS